ncbi:MAG: alkyl sulfatase dimerization domain-containing protein, partial [Pseudomonadota bacterium]
RCGVTLALHYAPGECADTVVVHLPGDNVLFSADNYYASFPNLYAIRGTPYRDFAVWADSLQKMAALQAEFLAPGHTRPLTGREVIQSTLADYEAAIRFIIAKTSDGMNEGLTPDELVAYVRLPAALREKPYLEEYYGTVEWAVRAYFAGTIGWFDGDPARLYPLAPRGRAERLAVLAGGVTALCQAAQTALDDGDVQWALELASEVLRLEPENAQAVEVRIDAMRRLAAEQVNACARNYYLLKAKQESQPGP